MKFKMQLHLLKIQRKGIAPENEHIHIRPLASFADGCAGQMFLFASLYQETSKPIFKHIVYALHDYQKTTWQKDLANWGDYRKHIPDLQTHWQHVAMYKNESFVFFKSPADDISFLYGTKGITYVYLKLYEIFKDLIFLTEAEKGLKKLAFTAADLIREIADEEIFSTPTGVVENINYSHEQFSEKVFNDWFPNAVFFYSTFIQPFDFPMLDFKNISQKYTLKECHSFLQNQAKKINDKSIKAMFSDIVKHEKTKIVLTNHFPNKALIRAEELASIQIIDDILTLENEDLANYQFKINERLAMNITKFDWEYFHGKTLPLKMEKHLLLLRNSKGILEKEIPKVELVLLQKFIEPIIIKEAIDNYLPEIEEDFDTSYRQVIVRNSFEIVRNLIFCGYIIRAKENFLIK